MHLTLQTTSRVPVIHEIHLVGFLTSDSAKINDRGSDVVISASFGAIERSFSLLFMNALRDGTELEGTFSHLLRIFYYFYRSMQLQTAEE